jgi:hypothetical protein
MFQRIGLSEFITLAVQAGSDINCRSCTPPKRAAGPRLHCHSSKLTQHRFTCETFMNIQETRQNNKIQQYSQFD